MYEEMRKSLEEVIQLFESWRDGVFYHIGLQWVEEPPAIQKARKVIEEVDYLRCTGDSFTCPVGHDHP